MSRPGSTGGYRKEAGEIGNGDGRTLAEHERFVNVLPVLYVRYQTQDGVELAGGEPAQETGKQSELVSIGANEPVDRQLDRVWRLALCAHRGTRRGGDAGDEGGRRDAPCLCSQDPRSSQHSGP
jgi:hypothetical protein